MATVLPICLLVKIEPHPSFDVDVLAIQKSIMNMVGVVSVEEVGGGKTKTIPALYRNPMKDFEP